MNIRTFTFAETGKMRLDSYLSAETGLTRTHIQKLIVDDAVKINDTPSHAAYKLKAGDRITIIMPEAKQITLIPRDLPLDIIYEDQDLIVINKAKGMVVHPGPGNEDYTLVHALLFHCRDLSGINGELRPGIVHRIDKDTSGLLVCAKNDFTHVELAKQLADKRCYRRYYALVCGIISHDEGIIDAPIGRDEHDRQRMAVTAKNSKQALTYFKVLKRLSDCTLVDCELKTGRTHQIRVHFKYIHHPLVNDRKYNAKYVIDDSGQYLHAYYLSFIHPTLNKRLEFQTAMPAYMSDFIKLKEKNCDDTKSI